MNAILTMSSFIFPIITFPYVSRILQPVGNGKVQFAISVINYFSMFAQMGIPTYGIRVCAQVRDDREQLTKTAHELLIINMVMSILSYAVFFASVLFIPRLRAEKTLFAIVSLTILFNAIGMEWLYKALEQYVYITIRSVFFKFVALIALLSLVHSQSDYVIYGGISIFAASASNILNFINARKYIDFKKAGPYNLRRHLKAVFIFFAMSCATTVYTNLDTVMLGFMKSDADVGYYNAAVKIKTILVSIVTSLGAVLLPRSSYYVEHGEMDEFRRISAKAINFVMVIAVPMMLFFIMYARPGIYFFSGEAYEGSIRPMQIIMPTLLFIGLTNIFGIQMLVPLGGEKTVLYSEIAGALCDLIINWLLIPAFASAGAAIGTVAAELVVLLVQMAALKNELAFMKRMPYIKVGAGAVFAVLASFWVLKLPIAEFFILLIGGLCFFGAYGIVLLLLREKMAWEIVRMLLSRFKVKPDVSG